MNNSIKVEQLGYKGLVILQDYNLYRFTTDAVLLANSVDNLKGKCVADICSGSGIISLLLASKKNAKQVVAIELQEPLAQLSRESVLRNGLQDIIQVVTADVVEICNQYNGYFDCVVCNPPYRKVGSGQTQANTTLALARHEIAITLQQVVQCASTMLNNKGSMYIVHQACRLAELCYLMKQHSIEPKVITPIASKKGNNANLVIVKGVKCGNVDCVVKETLYIYDDSGKYSDLVHSYYNSGEDTL